MNTKWFFLLGMLSVMSARGAYNVTVPQGASLIANQLDRGSNTLNEVLPTVPDGTIVQKWSCGASGTGPMTYRWYRSSLPLTDGARISGSATSTLTIRDVGVADAGAYGVVISNACGSLETTPATVTVQGPAVPRILQFAASPGDFQITFATETNALYRVEFTDSVNAALPLWLPLELVNGDGALHTSHAQLLSNRSRFYRVVLLSP